MEPYISIAGSRFPQAAVRGWTAGGGGRTAGIRGGYGCRTADGSMDSRQAAGLLVVLLLIIEGGHAEGPGRQDGDQISEEDNKPCPPPDAQTPGSLLCFLLQTIQRPSRGSAFLFQPQRFGRNTRSSWSNDRLSPRAAEGLSSPFWSLAASQRFGKK
ncbi:pro-FMRFamide-related neuropeptide FF [Manis javanica]|uniref:pro-FMRFamide-related neuropeptide FF n=1 Tax=Manis javanica TaxID=9974 RepID=UPI000813956B|nr:pro-FMRFamide-related neuropeptide FF [Manis javanica]